MTLRHACKNRDVTFVRGWILGRMMVEVPEDRVEVWIRELSERMDGEEEMSRLAPQHLISDGTCDLYLKAQMTKEGFFRAGGGVGLKSRLTVTLHTGSLGIIETPEELELLRRNARERISVGLVASPGIERTSVRIQPIDATAAVVAPTQRPEGT